MGHDIDEFPENYDETRLVLMARDPHCLFAYWEISKKRINQFVDEFGKDLWNRSVPVLKVTNVTRNYHFTVRINDFSDSWYINVPDADCLYLVELGRKVSELFFIGLVHSNSAAVPGNMASPDSSVFFTDYAEVRSGQFRYKDDYIQQKSRIREEKAMEIFGPSSPGQWLTSEGGQNTVSSWDEYTVQLKG